MFGLLDFKSCLLRKNTKQFYACNVCNSLSSNYGRSSRMMMNNDAIYLSLLIASQRKHLPYTIHCSKCKPLSKKSLEYIDFEYPASVSMLMSGVGFADDLHDESSIKSKVFYSAYKNKIRRAVKNLNDVGLDFPQVDYLVAKQHEIEKIKYEDVEQYSTITEKIYSDIFSQTACLAGEPQNKIYLSKVGEQIGRISYLLDSYIDLKEDFDKGSFNINNFYIKNSNEVNSKEIAEIKKSIEQHINNCIGIIKENINKVKFHRFEKTVIFMITEGLKKRVHDIIFNDKKMLSRPMVYAAFAPFAFFSVMQSGSIDDCCNCQICEFESMCISSEQLVLIHTITSAVTGAAGATIGFIGSALIGNLLSGGKPPSNEIKSNLTDKSPQDAQKNDNITKEQETGKNNADTEFIKRVEENLPPGTPKDFPLLGNEIEFLGKGPEDPLVKQEGEIVKNIKDSIRENIKEDVNEEKQREEQGITLKDEGIDLWKNRPDSVTKYYEATSTSVPGLKEIYLSNTNVPTNLGNDLIEKLKNSKSPEEREWIKKFQSFNRRKERFNIKKIREINRLDSEELGTIAGGRA